MRLLVQQLEKQTFAVTERPRCMKPKTTPSAKSKPAREVKAAPTPSRATRQRGGDVPAALPREVYMRDGPRYGYVDERGVRCCETGYLEFHHLKPFAKGGEHVAENLALRWTSDDRA